VRGLHERGVPRDGDGIVEPRVVALVYDREVRTKDTRGPAHTPVVGELTRLLDLLQPRQVALLLSSLGSAGPTCARKPVSQAHDPQHAQWSLLRLTSAGALRLPYVPQ
jgi:hypothetical protein